MQRLNSKTHGLTLWAETRSAGLIAVNRFESVDFFTVLHIKDNQVLILGDEQLCIIRRKTTIIAACVELGRRKQKKKMSVCEGFN